MLFSRRRGDSVTFKNRHLRIVFVSDNPDFVRAACESIESESGLIVVATAESGFASLIAVDVLRPDLVLMDVGMAGMDAVEATRRIKARPEPPAVVLITLHDPADIARSARDAGADAVISKRELGESAGCILRALGAGPESLTAAGSSPRPGDR
jgi:CheY-like chemotaxis protein